MTRKALRWLAIGIAVAALVDPSIHVSGRARPRISVLIASASRADEARSVRQDLEARLQPHFEVVEGADASAVYTVVVGDRYPDEQIDGKASTVSLSVPSGDGARILAVDAPKAVPPATAVHVVVDVAAPGDRRAPSTLVVSAAGVEVGRASHAWADDSPSWRAELDVVPVGEPPFVFHAEVAPGPDGRADVVVASRRDPMRVLVYEPRPSWASTFVRRALEADARFLVNAVTDVSRGIAVRAGTHSSLADISPEDIDVAVVGGLDRLTAANAAWLGRFMRERGGAVALVPDARIDRAIVRALVGDDVEATETLLEHAAALATRPPLPRIDASELLTFAPMGGDAIAKADGSDAIVIVPAGDGELLLSGALDAWRFRASPGVRFDEFWRSAMARLALDARAIVDADVTPRMLPAGAEGRVTVRVRPPLLDGPVAARIVNGEVIRLWPGASPGEFRGTFAAPLAAGVHAIRVSAGDAPERATTTSFVVGAGDASAVRQGPPLSLLSASRGGVDADDRSLAALVNVLADRVPAPEVPGRRRPMRSVWWFAPFSACLCAEWWLRRRNGLR